MVKFLILLLSGTLVSFEVFSEQQKSARSCVQSIHRLVERDARQAARYYYNTYLKLRTRYALPISFKKVESFTEEPVIRVTYGDRQIATSGFIIFKDRPSGIRELIEASRKSETELGWVFVPRYQVWLNVAIVVGNTGIQFHDDMLRYLPLMSETLELVHIHPFRAKTGLATEFLILPSHKDLVSLRSLNAVVGRTQHGFGIFSSSIASPFGLTRIRFNPRLVDQFFSATYRIDTHTPLTRSRTKLEEAIRRLSRIGIESKAIIHGSKEILRPFDFEFVPIDALSGESR